MTNKDKKVVKQLSTKTTTKKNNQKSKVIKESTDEQLFPAYQIIQMLNIPDFDLFMIRSEYKFDNGTLFTISDFKKMYKKVIEGR